MNVVWESAFRRFIVYNSRKGSTLTDNDSGSTDIVSFFIACAGAMSVVPHNQSEGFLSGWKYLGDFRY